MYVTVVESLEKFHMKLLVVHEYMFQVVKLDPPDEQYACDMVL